MSLIYVLVLIFIIVCVIYYKKKEFYEVIEDKKPITKYDKISYQLFPNCNFLEGDQGETCKKTKGCFYNNGCYFDWKNIQ